MKDREDSKIKTPVLRMHKNFRRNYKFAFVVMAAMTRFTDWKSSGFCGCPTWRDYPWDYLALRHFTEFIMEL